MKTQRNKTYVMQIKVFLREKFIVTSVYIYKKN